MIQPFFDDPQPFLASAAHILFSSENYKAMGILGDGEINLVRFDVYSESRTTDTGWHYNQSIFRYRLEILLPISVYSQITTEREEIESQIYSAVNDTLRGYEHSTDEGEFEFSEVVIKIKHITDPDWKERTKATLSGVGLTNQGRVRSDSIAPIVHQGLLFRSPAETRLFDALKEEGLLFAPLPVFIKSSSGNRIEPDFVVIDEGIILLVEVDGATYHTETPLAAQRRLEEFTNAGVAHIRIDANDCNSKPSCDGVVRKIKERLDRLKRIR